MTAISGRSSVFLARLLLAVSLLAGAQAAHSGVSSALLDIQERLFLEGSGRDIFPGASIYQPEFVHEFYELAGYQPVWTDAEYALEMLALLRDSELEGLNPADYHYDTLQRLRAEYQQPWSDKDQLRAQAEMLLTDGILLYARHLIQGKVDPVSRHGFKVCSPVQVGEGVPHAPGAGNRFFHVVGRVPLCSLELHMFHPVGYAVFAGYLIPGSDPVPDPAADHWGGVDFF